MTEALVPWPVCVLKVRCQPAWGEQREDQAVPLLRLPLAAPGGSPAGLPGNAYGCSLFGSRAWVPVAWNPVPVRVAVERQ